MKNIGTITKTHGYEGAVVVKSDGGRIKEPVKGEPVFIVIDGLPVPFFTREAYAPANDTLIISFDYYETPASVTNLKGCRVKTTGEDDNDDLDADITGFTVKDSNSSFTGVIITVTEGNGQMLAEVESGTRNILIPLHPDLIVSADRRKKQIIMSLPSGLTGIND